MINAEPGVWILDEHCSNNNRNDWRAPIWRQTSLTYNRDRDDLQSPFFMR